MSRVTTCLCCGNPIDRLDYILVSRMSMHQNYLVKLHPSCWAELAESKAQEKLKLKGTQTEMQNAYRANR